ncbi:MAG: ABC transporter substrate-binding protein [Sphingobacteriaceae bacterium]|nr:MAG: ABC transporter substrate-binding protein [Sphingobacteriaceae bacterium]
MKPLRIALDWTPNVNHVGIFVARELGLYEAAGIETAIINPLDDNYEMTPGKKLELGIADFAIAPFETVISLNNKENMVDAVAVFAILQEDISSIASLQTANLSSPKLLDGKVYASYKARYEDHIVKQMIKNDGGLGSISIIYPDKLGIWNTLLENKADATWIFDNWEGVEAETRNIALTKFSLRDYDIPYCYSPVIIARKSNWASYKNEYAAFIQATQKGYLYAAENKQQAVAILKQHLTESDKTNIDIDKAITATVPYFGDKHSCGLMQPERIQSFLKWLVDNQLENEKLIEQMLFTNDLLQ